MGKIGINLQILGKEKSYNVNVGKDGVFKCKIDKSVLSTLGITEKLESTTLKGLKDKIMPKYNQYLESKVVEELIIAIQYKSNGFYSTNKNGGYLFWEKEVSDEFHKRGLHGDADALAFSFKCYIKVSHSTGTVIWYEARQGRGSIHFDEHECKDKGKWYKHTQVHGVNGRFIPYSEDAYRTLLKAREGLRTISEILFDFVNQDEKLIEAQLNKGYLLIPTKKQ